MKRLKRYTSVLLLVPALALGSCAGSKSVTDMATQSLMGVLGGSPDLSMFTQLIGSAGLGSLLGGSDPMTLLAPTNEAIEALGPDLLNQLKDPASAGMLTEVLKNHMVAGKLSAADLGGKPSIDSLIGTALPVSQGDKGLKIGDANVLQSDIESSNGYIQKIDRVLLP